MTATVARLPHVVPADRVKVTAAKPARAQRRVPAASPASRRQVRSGVSVMAVAAVLTGLSLSHLAHGIEATTHTGMVDAWCMAAGIDLGFIATEAAALCATGAAAATIHRWARPMVGALVCLSAGMNAMSCAAGAVGSAATVGSALLGMTTPLMVYGLTRIGFAALTGRGA